MKETDPHLRITRRLNNFLRYFGPFTGYHHPDFAVCVGDLFPAIVGEDVSVGVIVPLEKDALIGGRTSDIVVACEGRKAEHS